MIVKRRIIDEKTVEDFDEDWKGEAVFDQNSTLLYVECADLRPDFFVDVRDCGKHECDTCKPQCFLNKKPRLPQFINDLDAISFEDDYGQRHYAIVIDTDYSDAADVNFIPLIEDNICGIKIKSKKDFYCKIVSDQHEHAPFVRVDTIKTDELPISAKKAYDAIIKYYERYNKKQNNTKI